MSSEIPQIVPSGRCLRCDVCCRFPEADSPMRPYFTAAEINAAIARGVPAVQFPDRAGGRVTVVPHPTGEGFMCPAFDVATNRCAIYDDRPLDCRLYPFVVMRPPEGGPPLLGWDRLCPYLREESDPMLPVAAAPTIARLLSPADSRSSPVNAPGFAGPWQDSVWMLEPLQPCSPFPRDRVKALPASPTRQFTPVGDDPDEIERLRRFLADAVEPQMSVRHQAVLMMWRPLMSFYWTELDGGTALVARQAATYFAPVPPRPCNGPSRGDHLASACRELLAVLNRLNPNPASSRIERIGKSQQLLLSGSGAGSELVCRAEGEEYLYDRHALAELRGDRYKSQRWNCNQAARRFSPRYEPYRSVDLPACLRLYASWRRLKERREPADEYAAALMADSFYAHWQALAHADDWGLAARVVRVEGEIRAYTIGAPLDSQTMLVMHEIADPGCPGLGPWLFREWCREWERYELVNVMDDSDLPSLRMTKKSYRATRQVPWFHVTAAASSTSD
jgi:Fe-S-cluster containining protein